MTAQQVKNWLVGTASVLGSITVIYGAVAWATTQISVKAQEYVNEVMAPAIEGLSVQIMRQNEQIEQFNTSIQQLIQGQSAETSQSAEEARINRRILCYQEALANNTDATPCEDIQ